MKLPIPQQYWNTVTQNFLNPDPHYQSGVHNGTDFACPIGTPIYAPCDGEITYRFLAHESLGKAVYFSGNGYYMRFLHLSHAEPRGKYMEGELIGNTGNSGDSTGPHLHLDVWNTPINTSLIKTRAGVQKYMLDPLTIFKQ